MSLPSLPLHKFQLSLSIHPPPLPLIQARNHEISKTGTGWSNSPQGQKVSFWGQFRVDAYFMVAAN